MDNDNDDIYAQHLKDAFDHCDLQDKGYLNRNELIDLAQKLQLNDQVPALLCEILGGEFNEGKVSFETFKEALINVLTNAIDDVSLGTTEDEQSEWSDAGEVFSRNNSALKTEFEEANGTVDTLFKDLCQKVDDVTSRKYSTPKLDKTGKKANDISTFLSSLEDETYVEGSGSLEPISMRKLATDTPDISNMNARQLRKVWDDFAVGESGFLNLLQLSTVCDHIGMGQLDDTDLDLLFNELDSNKDGFVSFSEFYNGLFAKTKSYEESSKSADSDGEDMLDSTKSLCSVKSLKEIVRDEGGEPIKYKQASCKQEEKPSKSTAIDILTFLDENDSGYVELDKMIGYFAEHRIHDFDQLFTELKPNSEGKVRLKHVSYLLEKTVHENDDSACKSVLKTFKREICHLRDVLDTSKSEITVLKNIVTQLDEDKKKLVNESEEQARSLDMKNKSKLKHVAEKYEKKLSAQEENLLKERDSMLQKHETENKEWQSKLQIMKDEEVQMKTKLKEQTAEVLRLEENLKDTVKLLNEERKLRTTLEKETVHKSGKTAKIVELERHIASLSNEHEKHLTQIAELQKTNKELRDQCDELYQLQDNPCSHEPSEGIIRRGSYLSDYVKPDFVKRNPDKSDDEIFANADMEELRIKVINQETTILSLRRDLESVNRQLEESASHSNERHRREVDRLTEKYTSEISALQNMLAIERDKIVNHYSKEKTTIVESYERKIDEMMMNFKNEKERLIKDYENERDRWETSEDGGQGQDFSYKKERRKIEHSFREEKEDIELNYRSKITKLEEKIVILETEKAEIELKFLNEKAELEQKFRIERAELQQNATTTSRELEKSQKYIDSLKEDLKNKYEADTEEIKRCHRIEKETMLDNMENEIEECNKKHQREINELKRAFTQQVSDMEKGVAKDKASMRESFNREKAELEKLFSREKSELIDMLRQEYEHDLSAQLAEARRTAIENRSSLEEELRRTKSSSSMNLDQERAQAERQLKQLKIDMEIAFTEERTKMKEQFELEKSSVENKYIREIAELQEAFAGGEAGLKGKMKDDFNNVLDKYKREWEVSHKKEKLQLQESYAREKAELELSWQVEKAALEENFDTLKFEFLEECEQEKHDLLTKFHKQKQRIEEEYHNELHKLKANRDNEFNEKLKRETGHLQTAIVHLEQELISLREQKKELETKNQVLELKVLSQKQEAVEISEYQSEKKQINTKVENLLRETTSLKLEINNLESLLEKERQEKTTILDNSVQEITDKQNEISNLQNEISTLLKTRDKMQLKLNEFKGTQNELMHHKREIANLMKEIAEKDRMLNTLNEVEKDNTILNKSVRSLESQENVLQSSLREKDLHLTQKNEELEYYKKQLEKLETLYGNEVESFNGKLNMQSTAFTTEKSRYLRELQELKDHLRRANLSSDRDNALKEKVFNDAKAEVMNLNKKLEEKSRNIRSLEETLRAFESKLNTAVEQREAYEREVHYLKTTVSENNVKANDEKKEVTTNSLRSNVLVTDLYVENATLMKQLANAETNVTNAEKQIRQLTDQKRALQRVISKLCHANGITSLS